MTDDFGRPTGDKLTISKQARKITQMRKTIDSLHERLAAVQSSKRNKASQIARLNAENDQLRSRLQLVCEWFDKDGSTAGLVSLLTEEIKPLLRGHPLT